MHGTDILHDLYLYFVIPTYITGNDQSSISTVVGSVVGGVAAAVIVIVIVTILW